MNQQDKYMIQYNKLMDSRSNLLDVMNFLDNTREKIFTEQEKKVYSLNLLEFEKSSERCKDMMELMFKELTKELMLIHEFEKRRLK